MGIMANHGHSDVVSRGGIRADITKGFIFTTAYVLYRGEGVISEGWEPHEHRANANRQNAGVFLDRESAS